MVAADSAVASTVLLKEVLLQVVVDEANRPAPQADMATEPAIADVATQRFLVLKYDMAAALAKERLRPCEAAPRVEVPTRNAAAPDRLLTVAERYARKHIFACLQEIMIVFWVWVVVGRRLQGIDYQ